VHEYIAPARRKERAAIAPLKDPTPTKSSGFILRLDEKTLIKDTLNFVNDV